MGPAAATEAPLLLRSCSGSGGDFPAPARAPPGPDASSSSRSPKRIRLEAVVTREKVFFGEAEDSYFRVTVTPPAGGISDLRAGLRHIIYALDGPLGSKHVPNAAKDRMHTVVVGLKVLDSPQRRHYFNREPFPYFMEERPTHLRFEKFILETIENDLIYDGTANTNRNPRLRRSIFGHSNGGPGALAAFAKAPHLFQNLVMLDPAVCDAPLRFFANQVYGKESHLASQLDADSTEQMFARVFETRVTKARDTERLIERPADPSLERVDGSRTEYRELWNFFTARDDVKKDRNVERDEHPIVREAWASLRAKNSAADWTHYVEPFERRGEASKRGGQYTVVQHVKNRLWAEHWFNELKKGEEAAVGLDVKQRSITIVYGETMPRSAKIVTDHNTGQVVEKHIETQNAFDWIPMEASRFAGRLRRFIMDQRNKDSFKSFQVKEGDNIKKDSVKLIGLPGAHADRVAEWVMEVMKDLEE